MREVTTMSVLEKALAIMAVPVLEGLASDEVALIAARTTETEFDEGETIEPGSRAAARAYIVVEGALEHTVDGRLMRRVKPGGAVGMGAVFGESSADERVNVVAPTRAITLARQDLERILADHPQVALGLVRVLYTAMANQARRRGEARGADE